MRVSITRRDDGQAVMLVIALLALTAVLLAGAAHLGGRVVDRARAQTAADAAALAGVTGGEDAARATARANGARLVEFHVIDTWTVEALVIVDGEGAIARASRAP